GFAGHLTNLPLASLQGAAIDGAEPAIRLSAVNANTSFFILSSLGTGSAEHRRVDRLSASHRRYKHPLSEWAVLAASRSWTPRACGQSIFEMEPMMPLAAPSS